MTIAEVIDVVNDTYPNEIDNDTKIKWLRRLDRQIKEEVIDTHELPEDYETPDFDTYGMDTTLIVEDLYAEIYEAYLRMKIAQKLLETKRYSMEQTNYNNYYITYQAYYNRHHMPNYVKTFYR